MTRLAAALALGALLTSCGGAIRRDPARLLVVVEPLAARVYVDDRYRATGRVLGRRALELAPGTHVVTLEADGYFPHDLRVELPEGETTIRASLRPIPP